MPLRFGAVADDFSGTTDLAGTPVWEGMRTVQLLGVPEPGLPAPDAGAAVAALKSRIAPAGEAVADSPAALDRSRRNGGGRMFLRYCSTYDSIDAGNIGPVADAPMGALGTARTIRCPVFPANGRMVCRGHRFVGDVLPGESGMRDHPPTPMTESNPIRVLGRRTAGPVGLIGCDAVSEGPDAIARVLLSRHLIVGAATDRHLRDIGEAVAGLPLVSRGSGLAAGPPDAYRRRNLLDPIAAGRNSKAAVPAVEELEETSKLGLPLPDRSPRFPTPRQTRGFEHRFHRD